MKTVENKREEKAMKITYHSAQEVLDALVRAYYYERNVDAVLSGVTEEIIWIGTEHNDSAIGKEELRKLLEADVKAFPDSYHIELEKPVLRNLGAEAVMITLHGKLFSVSGIPCECLARGTICCVRTKEGWLASNVHISIPNPELEKMIDEQHELKKLVDEVPTGLGIYEVTDGKIAQIYMNEAFYNMIGADRESRNKFFNENNMSAAHPDDADKIRKGIERLLLGEDNAEVAYRLKKQDGTWFWVNLNAHVVERTEHFLRFYASFSDYNRIKEAEINSFIEQQRFQVVADEMNAAVFEWDFKNGSFYSSSAYQKYAISRVSADDILHNRGPGDVVHPEDRSVLNQFFKESDSGSAHIEATLRLRLVEGGYCWCRLIGLFYRDEEHEKARTIGIIIDVNKEHEENYRLQKLLDEIPGGIGRYDYYDGILELTYLNDAYYRMLDLKRGENMQYYGINAMQAIHPEDASGTIQSLDRLAAGEDYLDIYHRIQNGAGEWIWMKYAASVTERSNGHTKIITVITNCNELIQTQERLQNQYEDQVRYTRMLTSDAIASSMVNLTKQTISLQDTETDSIMTIITQQTPQQGFEEMYGFIPDEVIRKEYEAIFDAEAIIREFEKGITHKSIRHPYENYECWYESVYDAFRNPKTNDLEVYCAAKDVSQEVLQRDVSQRIMAYSYDEVMLIHPVSGEPEVLIERAHNPVFAEQEKAGDYSRGLRNYILACSGDADPGQAADSLGLKAVLHALEEQETYSVSYSIYDQKHRLCHRRASYSYLNQYRTKILCMIQDITGVFEKETKQREELRQALADAKRASLAKVEFYSRMSHDMRTPMNGILGMAALSEFENDTNVLKENIKKIEESGQYLLSLINDTLDQQRIESGKMVLESQIVGMQDIMKNILDMIRPSANEKGVKLVFNSGNADLKWYIRVDALRLKQVFVNLLSNAVKFTPEGGTVSWTFQFLSVEDRISHDVIYVQDTGVGMSREFLENGIFKPFSQEKSEVSMKYAGSGLGLSIAKSLVELMGGRIEVESQLGVGTTFAVYLDFERVEADEAEAFLKKRESEKKGMTCKLQGMRILLAEDHPLNAEIAQKLLAKAGGSVTWTKDGLECLRTLSESEENTFDMILMDIRMPVMGGLQAAQEIRKLPKERLRTIPIVAMTANAYSEDIANCLAAGMNGHIAKPINPQMMYETLDEVMRKRNGDL